MIKKPYKIFLGLISANILPLSFLPLVACNNNEEIIEDPVISYPTNDYFEQKILQDGSMYVIIPGFSYKDSLEKNKLIVTSSFPTSPVNFQPTIYNWDSINKTFSIVLSTAISPIGTFTGSLKFSYNAGQIQTEGEHDFTIKLDTYRSIATPENIDDKQYLNQTGCATFTFYRFEYNNLPDLSKLTVSSTFEQAGTTFTYKVINATYSTFDLALSVKDATPAQLSGRLIFSYDGVQITEAPDVEFSINMLHAAEIYIPDDVKDRSIDLLVNPDAISVATFRNFRYSNILDPENIEIRGGWSPTILAETAPLITIANINKTLKTFDVRIEFNKLKNKSRVSFFPSFTYNNEVVLQIGDEDIFLITFR